MPALGHGAGVAAAAIILGVVLLAWSSDQFVLGAARIAVLRRVAPLVIGVVVIGFGTSSPEMVVSALAALRGEPEIAVGNIVGSNLANLGLILGIGVIMFPLVVDSRTVRREAPLTVAAMALFALLVQRGVSRIEGLVLLVAMATALALVIRRGPQDPLGAETVEFVGEERRLGVEIIRTLLGLAGTLAGAQILLWGALDLAEAAGLGEGFVGATLVAVGTSLPELVTVVQSARRKEGDLVLGNLLGSNLFNALAVGGITGVIGPGVLDAPALSGFAALACVALGSAVWMMMRTGRRISRVEGVMLVAGYGIMIPFLGVS